MELEVGGRVTVRQGAVVGGGPWTPGQVGEIVATEMIDGPSGPLVSYRVHFGDWFDTPGVVRTYRFLEDHLDALVVVLSERESADLAVVRSALAAVVPDLERELGRPASARADNYGDGVRLAIEGAWQEPFQHSRNDEEAVKQEIADFVQSILGRDGVWPVCRAHDFGLHPDLIDGVAVWRCRYADHSVARVGELDADNHP